MDNAGQQHCSGEAGVGKLSPTTLTPDQPHFPSRTSPPSRSVHYWSLMEDGVLGEKPLVLPPPCLFVSACVNTDADLPTGRRRDDISAEHKANG